MHHTTGVFCKLKRKKKKKPTIPQHANLIATPQQLLLKQLSISRLKREEPV